MCNLQRNLKFHLFCFPTPQLRQPIVLGLFTQISQLRQQIVLGYPQIFLVLFGDCGTPPFGRQTVLVVPEK